VVWKSPWIKLTGRLSHTRRISIISSFWMLMFPVIGCSAFFMESKTFSHTFRSGNGWPRCTIYIIFLFVVFCNSGTMYRYIITLKGRLIVRKISYKTQLIFKIIYIYLEIKHNLICFTHNMIKNNWKHFRQNSRIATFILTYMYITLRLSKANQRVSECKVIKNITIQLLLSLLSRLAYWTASPHWCHQLWCISTVLFTISP
jgi:hypothetical protein